MIRLEIPGQIKSGKNNMGVSRSGKHYPKLEWAAWRDSVMVFMQSQFKAQSGKMFDKPVSTSIVYTPGDKRRRDVPGMIDALWHCLERAGIVSDDALIQDVNWNTQSVGIAGVKIEIAEK